jgi:hypothetical protein
LTSISRRPSRFAAEHWKHPRTTNVIESSFETVRHPHSALQGCLSNKAALAMIFKLGAAAERNWRRLDGHNQLPKVILGVKFTDGSEVAAACPPPSPRFGDSSLRTTVAPKIFQLSCIIWV